MEQTIDKILNKSEKQVLSDLKDAGLNFKQNLDDSLATLESEYDNGESGSASWWVTGTVYFNLSSMTSGQENTVPFEFFR